MTTTESTARKRITHRGLWLLLAVPLLLGAGAFAFRAHAMGGGFGMGFGPGMGGSPAEHKAFMEQRLDRMLGMVKATDSQRTAIKAIFERTFAEMQPVHQQHEQLHDALVKALTADTVDRTAVEELRTKAAALFDQASQTFTKGLLDSAQVLSAEQRRTLVNFMQEHHGRHHGRP